MARNDPTYHIVGLCLMVEGVQYRQHAGVLVEMEGIVCLTGQPEDQLRVGGLGEWEDEEECVREECHHTKILGVISLAAINSGGGGSKAWQIQLMG